MLSLGMGAVLRRLPDESVAATFCAFHDARPVLFPRLRALQRDGICWLNPAKMCAMCLVPSTQ